jgi:hypothetical protein
MPNTSFTQVKKALESPDADETFAKFQQLGFEVADTACLMNKEICDKQSLIKATVQDLIEAGLTPEKAAALKAVFPSAS